MHSKIPASAVALTHRPKPPSKEVKDGTPLPPDVIGLIGSFLLPKDVYHFGLTDKYHFHLFCYVVTKNLGLDTIISLRKIQLGKEYDASFDSFLQSKLNNTPLQDPEAKQKSVMRSLNAELASLEKLPPEEKFLRFPEGSLAYIKHHPQGIPFLKSEQLDNSPVMVEKLSTGQLTLDEVRTQRNKTLHRIRMVIASHAKMESETDLCLFSTEWLKNKIIQGHIIDESMTISQVLYMTNFQFNFLTGGFFPLPQNQKIFRATQQCFKSHPYFLKDLMHSNSAPLPSNSAGLFMQVMRHEWIRDAVSEGKLAPENSYHHFLYDGKDCITFALPSIQKAVDKNVFEIDQVIALDAKKLTLLLLYNALGDAVVNDSNSKKLFLEMSSKCESEMLSTDGCIWFNKAFKSAQLSAKTFLALPEERKAYLFLKEIQQALSDSLIMERDFTARDDDSFVALMQNTIREANKRQCQPSWVGKRWHY